MNDLKGRKKLTFQATRANVYTVPLGLNIDEAACDN